MDWLAEARRLTRDSGRELQDDRSQAGCGLQETEVHGGGSVVRLEDRLQYGLIAGAVRHGEVNRLRSPLRNHGLRTDLDIAHPQELAYFLFEAGAQRGSVRAV